jgi:hypothetical protein
MNATPIQPDSNERRELARLLPELVERDLPSDRHQRLQEFVMSQIHQDLRSAEQPPSRSPKRRPVLLATALTAVAAATAAVVIGIGGSGGSGGGSVTPAATSLSARQVLLAAAVTAERTPESSGTYWYVKTVLAGSKDSKSLQWENWTQRGGRTWFRGDKSGGKVVEIARPIPFRLGGPDVSFEQLQKLPTEPDTLKSWIAEALKHSDVRTSAGRPDANMQKQFVFDGLISLVSQLPAPPKVRAAAFRAIASYPNVRSLGAVKGGQGLQFSLPVVPPPASAQPPNAQDQKAKDQIAKDQKARDKDRKTQAKAQSGRTQTDYARIVVDPATAQLRETNFFVSADGAEYFAPDGSTIVAEWTNLLPE